jgi:hypothetical protein
MLLYRFSQPAQGLLFVLPGASKPKGVLPMHQNGGANRALNSGLERRNGGNQHSGAGLRAFRSAQQLSTLWDEKAGEIM